MTAAERCKVWQVFPGLLAAASRTYARGCSSEPLQPQNLLLVQVNESADPLLALRKAERQIRELRQELAMRDMLSGRGRVLYEDLSEGERLELQQLALRYLSGASSAERVAVTVATAAAVVVRDVCVTGHRGAQHSRCVMSLLPLQALPSWMSCPQTA